MTLPFGIDISKYQNPDLIDYDKIAEQVDFVILRIGFGWLKDIYFERHYLAFTQRGKRIGGYHFPLNTRLQEQANMVKQALDGKRIEVVDKFGSGNEAQLILTYASDGDPAYLSTFGVL